MPAQKISLENAKPEKLFYFVANVVVYRGSDGRCLILRRSEREKVHPGKWCVPGGKLEWKDLDLTKPTRMNGDVYDFEGALEDLLSREAREEAGVELDTEKGFTYINSIAFVRPDSVPVMMIKVAAWHKSGEVEIQEGDFTDFAWVNAEEIKSYDCILGIPEEVEKTIKLFS